MQHRKSRLRLNQKPHHAAMLQRNLVTSLILYEKIRTTRKRAKVVQPMFDRLVTIVKTKEPREAIRAINAVVMHQNASKKLVEVLKGRFAQRPSGYSRIVPVGARIGDGAQVVDLELMDRSENVEPVAAEEKAPAKKKTTKKTATATAA